MTEIQALLLSCAIEGPLAGGLTWAAGWRCRGGPLNAGFASIVATAVTHPQFVTAMGPAAHAWGYWPALVALEIVVALVEAGLIAWMVQMRPRHALMLSAAANLSSCLAGIVLF